MSDTAVESRLTAAMINDKDGFKTVSVTEKGKLVGSVTFGPSNTTIVMEKAYTNWSRQVVRLARTTAGV